ncbi:MAG: hypothetical protein ABJG88_02620 [Litorimonas sp.]
MMKDLFQNIAFDPLISSPLLIGLTALLFLAALASGIGRLKSYFARLVAGLFLILALMNPQAVDEDRESLADTVLVLTDTSESMQIGQRAAIAKAIETELQSELSLSPDLDVITVKIPPSTNGTNIAKALSDGLATLPKSRLAGVITITDGRAHDITEETSKLLPEGVPFHALIIGNETARDRRISAIKSPKFGVVGEQAEFELQVDDPGFEGERARIEVKLNGTLKARFPITIGNPVSIPLEIERRGSNTVEMIVQGVEGELTLNNNLFVSEISGVRDRLRVLLITGEPHNGGRSWRNLLKSDPALDLVQFTILTVPGVKIRNARANELSLIPFPTRQLFEEKLDEFDLIIFDQYERRSFPTRSGRRQPNILPQYYQNITRYVENGGGLLLATGPAFAGQGSLFRTPLVSILPSRPNGEVIEDIFRPTLNEKGARHPITSSFQGETSDNWGHWYRAIDNDPISGDVLMDGPNGSPLFIIDKVQNGRVAMLMSDQAWLWAKGHDDGGPYREMFRRTAHWLMGEPDLDAEVLRAVSEDGRLKIERRSLNDVTGPMTVTYPNGTQATATFDKGSDGIYRAELPLRGQGAYRLAHGNLTSITAIGALNPREYAQLLPSQDLLAPLAQATGGRVVPLGLDASKVPTIRRVDAGKKTTGRDWLGLVAHKNYVVNQSRRTPLAPGILFFMLFFIFLAWAWRKEGQ